MRDIRGDLQERAIIVDEQIRAAAAHFDKAIQQLQTERDARIADLKVGLAMIAKFMEFEERSAHHTARDFGLPFSCTGRALFEKAQ